jgi:hypothetical protein
VSSSGVDVERKKRKKLSCLVESSSGVDVERKKRKKLSCLVESSSGVDVERKERKKLSCLVESSSGVDVERKEGKKFILSAIETQFHCRTHRSLVTIPAELLFFQNISTDFIFLEKYKIDVMTVFSMVVMG